MTTTTYPTAPASDVRTMSEIEKPAFSIANPLIAIIELLKPSWVGLSRVQRYQDVARRLSGIVHKSPAWGWRYIQSVAAGTVEPSAKLTQAADLLLAEFDGLPAWIGITEPVTIYAFPGDVKPGSIAKTKSKPCARPGCAVWFLPASPRQRYCCPECRDHKRGNP